MNAERMREYLLTLPHVIEAEQFGGLIYWVGDKAIGGRTCAMLNLESDRGYPISFPAGPEHFAELCEHDGMVPAPYSAQHFWIAAERWDALRDAEWREELAAAHRRTFDKLPKRTREALALPKAQLRKLVAERRKVLEQRAAVKKAKA